MARRTFKIDPETGKESSFIEYSPMDRVVHSPNVAGLAAKRVVYVT